MTNFICEYCNKKYSTKSTLSTHQKSTKKCLDLQKKVKVEIIVLEYCCQYCDKKFTSKQNIKNHESSCKTKKIDVVKEMKENYETEIENLKNENQRLREIIAGLQGELKSTNKASDCIYEIAKQPKVINSSNNSTNNSINKNLNISNSIDFKNIDKVKEIIDKNYDINHILGGQKGAAQFAAKYLLVDENGKYVYLCSDPSRNSFKYKNENGDIEKDLEAKKLTNYLVDGGIQEKVKDLSLNWCIEDGKINQDKFMVVTDKQISILNMKDNNTEFKKELASIVS